MKAGDSSAGYGYEHERPYRLPARVHICEIIPYLRYCVPFRKDSDSDTDSHNYQTNTEQRIYPAYDLIDRDKRRNKVVSYYNAQPDYH